VVAVGESGLDYHHQNASREAQRRLFEAHIGLALEVGLPLILHCREAFGDCLAVLKERAGRGLCGVAHCFGGSAEMAEEFQRLGFYISFGGPITFPNARRVREVARAVALERMVVETDAPYLAPQQERGRRNEPAFLTHVVAALAEVRGMEPEEVARVSAANAARLFGLPVFAGEPERPAREV